MCIAFAVILTAKRSQRAAQVSTKEYETAMPGMTQGIYIPENEMSQWDRSIAEWFALRSPAGNDVLGPKDDDGKPSRTGKLVDRVHEVAGPPVFHLPLLTQFLELDKPSLEAADERRDASCLVEGWSDYPGQSAAKVLSKPQSAKSYEPIQERAAKRVISDIMSLPDGHQDHVKTYAGNIVLNIAYGRTEKVSYSDPDIQLVNQCGDRLGQTLRPGSFMVESLPWLRYVPGYTKKIDQWHSDELTLFRGQLDMARENLSASAINIMIMAAAVYPDAQRRVQDELDRVIGRERLPTFDDQEDLPVTWAFIRETYRWRPVSSGGEHSSVSNTRPPRMLAGYMRARGKCQLLCPASIAKACSSLGQKGFLIPAGTPILGNHWGIHLDPVYYPDPERFNIDRWLVRDDAGDLTLNKDMKHFQFGFGRRQVQIEKICPTKRPPDDAYGHRVCPGQHIADRSVFINTSNLLWAFNIAQVKDQPIDTLAFTNAANSHPLPYKVSFKPRFDGVKEILSLEQRETQPETENMAKDNNDALIASILNKHRAKNAQNQGRPQGRASPVSRDRPYDRPAPAGPGDNVWKHDLYEGSRLSDRMQGGSELLPGNRSHGMRGFNEGAARQRNAPVELLGGQEVAQSGPARTRPNGSRLFQNAMGNTPSRSAATVQKRNINDAPVELLAPESKPTVRAPPPVAAARPVVQEQSASNASFGIKGAGNPQMKVVIEGLVQGTTAVDVEFAFKQHVNIIAAALVPSSNTTSVSAELTVENREVAQQMVEKFNGIIADGNPLKVWIIEPPAPAPIMSLKDRMRSGPGNAMDVDDGPAQSPTELLPTGAVGKLYSDQILQTDPRASITTVEAPRQNRQQRGGNVPASRGRGGAKGSLLSRLTT
ncbi:hypothetical protein QFC21_005369 [Naganishia friedmannii]|uniref:Uncharacterized protein n=1 Tax=Naganishia friedmannii TaxID=89922 RepID=A0ACC2VA89_9TREE|nr:hypothetical protein QFC21_005369 [Naganishia friedmannii]